MPETPKPPPKCTHESYEIKKFRVRTVKNEAVGIDLLLLRICIVCKACHRPFLFRAPVGFSSVEPTMTEDATTLLVPFDFPDDADEPLEVDDIEDDEEDEEDPSTNLLN